MSTTDKGRCPQCGTVLTRCNGLAEGQYVETLPCMSTVGTKPRLARLDGIVALTCSHCEYCTTEAQGVRK